MQRSTRARLWATPLTLCAFTACPALSVAAGTCDAVRTLIDTKIKASGVTDYSLIVVEADAKVGAGKVVGTCDRDQRKIVYMRGDTAAPAGTAAPTASSAPTRTSAPRRGGNEAILTECKDGTVSRGGDCRK
jgi:hypothetical protein